MLASPYGHPFRVPSGWRMRKWVGIATRSVYLFGSDFIILRGSTENLTRMFDGSLGAMIR